MDTGALFVVVVSKMFTAVLLLTRTGFRALKGNTKYVNSNAGTNVISAVKIMECLNLVWKMITKVAATNATSWKVAPSGTQGRGDHALLSQY